jgi:hypothetical protein
MSKVNGRVTDSENCHFTAKNRLFSSSFYGIEIRGFFKSAHRSWHGASRRVRVAYNLLSERGLPLRLISGNPIAVSPNAWTGRSNRFLTKRNWRSSVGCDVHAADSCVLTPRRCGRIHQTEMFTRCANN